jgi:hypothetical protein
MKNFLTSSNTIQFFAVISAAVFCPLSACAASIEAPAGKTSSISQAIVSAKPGDTVVVSDGVYRERVMVKAGVTLKARSVFKSIIDGMGKGDAVTLGGGASIIGFEIRHATVGVISKTSDNSIIRCRITGMRESGIMCVGRPPKIEDNIIVFNKGSGIQGWDAQASDPSAASINHNTVAFNGQCGIALEGKSIAIVENNIIAFNERLGLKIPEGSLTVQAKKNVIYNNPAMSYIKINDNYVFDPKFAGPRKMDFSLQPDSPCKAKASDGEDLGARYK